MKKILLVLVALVVLPVFTHAQNDTLYLMKHGVPNQKISIRQADVDSIVFYSRTSARNDTMYVMKRGVVVHKYSIKSSDIDSLIFYNPNNPTAGSIAYISIPAGSFMMGSPTTEFGRRTDEAAHSVILSAFKMSKYEISNAQYAAFLNAKRIGSNGIYAAGTYPTQALIEASSGSSDWGLHYTNNKWVPVAGCENHPVILVSWYGATEFASYVGGQLPTEAQWEYACRAGTSTPFNTDNFLTNSQANYNWSFPYNGGTNTITTAPGKPQKVGSYSANAWGLYDMHGNVGEWCRDRMGYYTTNGETDPTGSTIGAYRTFRGGNWLSDAGNCRSAARSAYVPTHGDTILGFRVVFTP